MLYSAIMANLHLHLVTILLGMLSMSQGQPASIYEPLVKYVTSQTKPSVVPQPEPDTPLEVDTRIGLMDIEKVDRHKNQVFIRTWFATFWNSSIQWDPKAFNGIKKVSVPSYQTYVPRIVSFDTGGHYQVLSPYNTFFVANGVAGQYLVMRWCLMCDMTEEDTCTVKLIATGHPNDVVHLRDPAKNPIDVTKMFNVLRNKGSDYKVKSESYSKGSMKFEGFPGEYDYVEYKFSFRDKRAHREGPVNIFRWH